MGFGGFWVGRKKGIKKTIYVATSFQTIKNVRSPQRGSTIVSLHLVPEKWLGFGLLNLPTLSDESDEILPILNDP